MAPWMLKLGATALSSYFANRGAGKAQDSANQNADWAYGESAQRDYKGMFGGYEAGGRGEYLNPEMQAAMDAYGLRAGQQADEIGNYSMKDRAGMVYDQDMALLAPEFAAQSAALEARQLAQGRSGSTGGAGQFTGLLNSQATTGQRVRRDSWERASSDLDNMRRRQQEDRMAQLGIGDIAGGYSRMSLDQARFRSGNAWNAARMKSGAALGKAGAQAAMLKGGLQAFNGQGYDKDGNKDGGMAEGMMESIRNYMNPPGIQGPGAVRPPGIQGPVGGPSNMGPGSFGPGPDRFNGNLGDTLFGEGGITDMRARAPWEMNNVYRQQPMIAPTPY